MFTSGAGDGIVKKKKDKTTHVKPKAHRLTFDTTMTADEIILQSFGEKELAPKKALPALHGTVEEERKRVWKAAHPAPVATPIIAPPAVQRWVPNDQLGTAQQQVAGDRAFSRAQERRKAAEKLDGALNVDELTPNLRVIYGVLKAAMQPDGGLSANDLTVALLEFNVIDPSVPDEFHKKLVTASQSNVSAHVGNIGLSTLSLDVIMRSLDRLINGKFKEQVHRTCFQLLHADGMGYIHKAHLDKIKERQKIGEALPGVTPYMVKVMSDVFIAVLAEEEENYLAANSKGKKKKKKAPALPANQKSHIPITKMRVAHIDQATFSRYFTESKELAAAFMPAWLQLFCSDGHIQHSILMELIDARTTAMQDQENPSGGGGRAASPADAE